jgi:hypothetical protein
MSAVEELKLLKAQVQDVARVCKAVADGDLSQKITVPVQGVVMVQLKDVINTMVDKLGRFAQEVCQAILQWALTDLWILLLATQLTKRQFLSQLISRDPDEIYSNNLGHSRLARSRYRRSPGRSSHCARRTRNLERAYHGCEPFGCEFDKSGELLFYSSRWLGVSLDIYPWRAEGCGNGVSFEGQLDGWSPLWCVSGKVEVAVKAVHRGSVILSV